MQYSKMCLQPILVVKTLLLDKAPGSGTLWHCKGVVARFRFAVYCAFQGLKARGTLAEVLIFCRLCWVLFRGSPLGVEGFCVSVSWLSLRFKSLGFPVWVRVQEDRGLGFRVLGFRV